MYAKFISYIYKIHDMRNVYEKRNACFNFYSPILTQENKFIIQGSSWAI